ncbi:MAG: hypothetical protein IJQ48_02275 [Prevotella sp.]|nr:hypothetical protein [Prevotella sp.]
MEAQEQAIELLRRAVERALGRRMQTNKDFDCLADCIYEKIHAKISTTTLKRIWGYLSEGVTPRRYTLDQLARFIGYDDFDAFSASLETDKAPESDNSNVGTGVTPRPQEDTTTEEAPSKTPLREGEGPKVGLLWKKAGVGLLLAIVATLLFFLLRPTTNTSADNDRILKKGQVFASYDDFLPLFGIDATESQHYQYVPDEEHIVVWSPEYHNPYYHNDGNPDSLMPTITEYYHPEDWPTDSASMAQLAAMHKQGFLTAIKENQVRLCFMKNLLDSNFVFLGVYRVSLTLSDTTKVVWARAHDECDLDNISFLNNYRN